MSDDRLASLPYRDGPRREIPPPSQSSWDRLMDALQSEREGDDRYAHQARRGIYRELILAVTEGKTRAEALEKVGGFETYKHLDQETLSLLLATIHHSHTVAVQKRASRSRWMVFLFFAAFVLFGLMLLQTPLPLGMERTYRVLACGIPGILCAMGGWALLKSMDTLSDRRDAMHRFMRAVMEVSPETLTLPLRSASKEV